jgi:divalent metal cation (Fe/Co/Zn/Cd) transporter
MFVDLHIGVDSSLSLKAAHKVAEEVGDRIRGAVEGVEDVVVHMEPKDYCELSRELNGKSNEGQTGKKTEGE